MIAGMHVAAPRYQQFKHRRFLTMLCRLMQSRRLAVRMHVSHVRPMFDQKLANFRESKRSNIPEHRIPAAVDRIRIRPSRQQQPDPLHAPLNRQPMERRLIHIVAIADDVRVRA